MNEARQRFALPVGTIVGPCRIEGEPTQWGFCLVYPGLHQPTGRPVTLHELLPEELVTRGEGGAISPRADAVEEFAWVREQFVEEGRRLGEYAGVSLQRMIAVLQENGTACWVTAPDEPRTLKQWLQELGRPPAPAEFQPLFLKIMDAVEEAHAHKILHLNLKPETVQLTPEGEPLLAHFAVARQAIARRSHGAGMATAGYSAPEQYDPAQREDERTDLYALGAIGYRAITGAPPPDAEQRLAVERYEKLAGRFPAWPPQFLGALDAALQLEPKARPPAIAAWRRRLERPSVGVFVASHPRLALAGALAGAALLTALALWLAYHFFFPPKPPPPKPDKDKSVQEEKSADKEQKADSEKKSADQLAEEQKAAEEKAAQAAAERMAAEKRAAEAAEAARLAANADAKAAAETAAQQAAQARAAQALAEEAAAKLRAQIESAAKERDDVAARLREQKEREAKERDAAEQARRAQMAREAFAAKEVAAKEAALKEAAAKEAALLEEAKRQAAARATPPRGGSGTGWSDGGKTSADAKFAGAFTGTGVGGVWETTERDAGGKPLMTLTITTKGQFKVQSAGGWSDHGESWSHLGMMQMQSAVDRRLVVARYVLKSLSVMTTTGALGEREWRRTGSAPSE